MYIFVLCLKTFDQVAGQCLGTAMCILGHVHPRQGRRAVRVAGRGVCVFWPPALLSKATADQASVPRRRPQLCSPKAPQPCAREPGAGLSPSTAGHGAGLRPTWPWQTGSELRRQIGVGGQCHCCPDFFSFWKLKLVRLFSFLCF